MNKENGCGPIWMPKEIKDSYFKSECDLHDRDYLDGRAQAEADKVFYVRMVHRINADGGLTYTERMSRRAQAFVFYHLVRRFGWLHTQN